MFTTLDRKMVMDCVFELLIDVFSWMEMDTDEWRGSLVDGNI